MRKFQDTFETRKRSFINAFSICMTVPLRWSVKLYAIMNIREKTTLTTLANIFRTTTAMG